jgi:23S rRNA (uracil1939-C5)-methyltransferase
MTVELVPTELASGGDAIARDCSGKAVFIRGALPGERVKVEIVAERRRFSLARVSEIVDPSPLRIEPVCPEVDRGCGACQWQHMGVSTQLEIKDKLIVDSIRRIGGFEPPDLEPAVELQPWAFRTTVRAGVVDGTAGFYRMRSNSVLPVAACAVAHPLLAELLEGRRYLGAEEVLLRCGARTGERLVSTRPTSVRADVPNDVRHDYLHEYAAGRSWQISASSFFQTRPDGVDALASIVLAAASVFDTPSRAVDLYSGVGLFAGVLADRGWSVTAVEGSRTAITDARINLGGLDVRCIRCDVNRWSPSPAELVVADPSRVGLGSQVVRAVVKTRARRVILISCDAVSLARDAALLRRAGYAMTSVTQFDLFPHTFHIEVVAIFDASDFCGGS